jgi:hypothetical protein
LAEEEVDSRLPHCQLHQAHKGVEVGYRHMHQ